MSTRSKKLRKYERVYKEYIKKDNIKEKSPRESRQKEKVNIKLDIKCKKTKKNNIVKTPAKKKLNEYQKFVKSESKKDIYKDINNKERFTSIAKKWNSNKNKMKNI